MRKKGVSPYLLVERQRIRTAPTAGIAHRIADGETPLAAWRVESAMTIARLDRLTGIAGERLIQIEAGHVTATEEELHAIAKSLKLAPELLTGTTGPDGC